MSNKQSSEMQTFAVVLAHADKADQVINGKREQVAQELLALASGLSTPEQFEAGCASAESQRKSRILEQSADKGLTKKERKAAVRLPASWSNAKSILLRGWEDHGLIPNDYETFSQYKEAKAEAVKLAKGDVQKKVASVTDGADGYEMMENGSVTAVFFGPLLEQIKQFPSEVQEEIALELEGIISKFHKSDVDELEEAQIQQAVSH